VKNGRLHRALSPDGTEIVGHVYGQGPPLVLVHGRLEDGDLSWNGLLPFLTERFTCYPVSTRGRGLSADNPDKSPGRLVEDVIAFAESVGDQVGLLGHSSGAGLALDAAAHTTVVSSVAAYEPSVPTAYDEADTALVADAAARMAQAAAEGRLADAARIIFEDSSIATDEEIAALGELDHFTAMGPYVPVGMEEMRQAAETERPPFSDPSILTRVTVPVLLLRGARTPGTWATNSVDHVAEHLVDRHVRQVADAGHFGPQLAPAAVAVEIVQFWAAEAGLD
jgi:pimeloyl-ACP methyl ester carboxylesterase